MQATAGADAAPAAATDRRGTIVEPLMFGEKKIYHTNGEVSYETANGDVVDEEDFYE